jgi:hypothetical protein
MPVRWISKPVAALEPKIPPAALAGATPGGLTGRQRLGQAVAAGSLLALAAQPFRGPRPGAAASGPLTVTNLNPAGAGSLAQAIDDANANPGPDTITFSPGLTGTIPVSNTLVVTDSLTIVGPGPGKLSVSGGSARRVFYLNSASSVPFTATITGLTIRDGDSHTDGSGGAGILDLNANLVLDEVVLDNNTGGSKGNGGGLNFAVAGPKSASLTIRDSIVSGNHGFVGGGVLARYALGGVVIQNTQFTGNSASVLGGGIFFIGQTGNTLIEDATFAYNTAGQSGAGVAIKNASGGPWTIRRTSIVSNTANIDGGGLYSYVLPNELTIENTTVSGNSALAGGGGLAVHDANNVSIRNSTIVSNSAVTAGGGVEVIANSLVLSDTIIAGNLAPLNQDISGTFQLRYDLVQVTGTATISDAGGNLFGLDPLLGPLANNGGPTQTHLPAHNSPAVNAGDPAFAPPPATDQRGLSRTAGRLDIGAVERQTDLFLPLVQL